MVTPLHDPNQLLDAAIDAARHGPNRVRHVGAVLVSADGHTRPGSCNTCPSGVQDTPERHAGNGRLVWMEQAERNAIHGAARGGIATEGTTLEEGGVRLHFSQRDPDAVYAASMAAPGAER
jgi:dCMP deaminase